MRRVRSQFLPSAFRLPLPNRRPRTAVAGLLALVTLGLALAPTAMAQVLGRPQTGSFGPNGTSATTFSGGLVNQLAFSQANDKLYAVAKGATNSVAASIHSFDAPAHTASGGSFPMAVAAPGAEPDIAVDNTTGAAANNLYYSSESTNLLYGFTSAGSGLAGWPASPATPRDICGIAVDPSGDIWATNFSGGSAAINKGVHRYNSAGVFQSKVLTTNETGTTAAGGPCHVTFDSNGDMYVNAFNGAVVGVWRYTSASGYTSATRIDPVATRALTVDRANHRLYVVHAAKVSVYDSAGTLLYEFGDSIGGANFRGIAIDESTDTLYLSDAGTNATTAPGNNRIWVFGATQAKTDASAVPTAASNVTESSATLNASVTDNNFFPTNWRLEYSLDGVSWTSTATGTTQGSQTTLIAGTASGLLPNTVYRYRVVTNKGSGSSDALSPEATFLTDGIAPTILSTSSDTIEPTSARLTGYINPNSSQTTYRFEWGTQSGEYSHRVPMPNALVGAGPKPVLVAQQIGSLEPATEYYFRIVAVGASYGSVTGAEQHLTTRSQPAPERVAELVSPLTKSAGGHVGVYNYGDIDFQASQDGQSAFYPIAYGIPDSTAAGGLRYLATRQEGDWVSRQVTPQQTVATHPDSTFELPGIFRFISDDLSCAVFESAQPLTADAPVEVRENSGANLFARRADGTVQLLTPDTPTNVSDPALIAEMAPQAVSYLGKGWSGAASSPDCSRTVFQTPYRYAGLNGSGIYKTEGGALSNVAVRPDGTSPTIAEVEIGSGNSGVNTAISWRAISQDADRVYFSAFSTDAEDLGGKALYLREGDHTIKVSASETGTVNRDAYYQIASPDGTKVAFMANYGLTTPSSTGPSASSCRAQPPRPCALYVYDVVTDDLTDISTDVNPADTNGATVAGVVAASDDLTRIYFAASGQLVAGRGRTYSENIAAQTANLYLWDNGVRRFVANVAMRDLVDDAGPSILVRNGGNWTSQTTPDGDTLLFSSRSNIVGYASGIVSQAYVYSLDSGEVVCASCRRDGEPSVGTGVVGSGTTATLIAHDDDHNSQSLARSLSVDGKRAFFMSPDALAPGGIDGNANVYVWDRGLVQLLATGSAHETHAILNTGPILYGASASGDDVFIRTPQALDPRDTDGANDLYDIRVGGQQPVVPPASPPCDVMADTCQDGGASAISPVIGTGGDGAGQAAAPLRGVFRTRKLSTAQLVELGAGRNVSLVAIVNQPGKVTVRGTARVGRRRTTVIAASRVAAKSGAVVLAIRLSPSARHTLVQTGRLRVRLKTSFSAARRSSTASLVVKARDRRGRVDGSRREGHR